MFCTIDRSFKIVHFDIYLQLSFICIVLSVGIFYNILILFYNVLNVTISDANTIIGCVGDIRENFPCLYSAWEPLQHHVNVYSTSCSSYSSNSNGLSSQNFDNLEDIRSMKSSSSSRIPSDMDGNSEAYNPDLDPCLTSKNQNFFLI